MDYFPYEKTVPADIQRDAFIRQIEMANNVNKPVLIHMRLAKRRYMPLYEGTFKVPGIMHCYSGGFEAMQEFPTWACIFLFGKYYF